MNYNLFCQADNKTVYPVLFRFFGIPVESYYFFSVLGLIGGYGIALKRRKDYSFTVPELWQLFILSLIIGLFGARLVHFLFWELGCCPRKKLFPGALRGGFSLYGLILGGFLGSVLWAKTRKKNPGVLLDWIAPSIAIFLSFARIGCFLQGCCYGKISHLPWAVKFHVSRSIFPWAPRHPVQLYESLSVFLLFEYLFRIKNKSKFNGELFLVFLLGYGLIRSLTEMYRGDVKRIPGLPVTWNHIWAFAIIAVSFYFLLKKNKKTALK